VALLYPRNAPELFGFSYSKISDVNKMHGAMHMPRMGTVGGDLNHWPKSRAYQAWEESAPPNLNDAKIEI
jgi:hypothetical protein